MFSLNMVSGLNEDFEILLHKRWKSHTHKNAENSEINYKPIFTYLSYSVSLDESRKPFANGFESILSLVISWFW